jgi:hypothetical protein
LLHHHTRLALRACVALALAAASTVWQGVAHAETKPEPLRQNREAPPASLTLKAYEPKVEILARGSFGTLGVGTLQLGLEGAYFPTPHFGFGATYEAFTVDTLEYPDPGTLSSGAHGMAFAEGDLLKGFITPYARLGVGLGRYQRYRGYALTPTETDFVGQVAVGLALRLGPVQARISAAPSLYGKDALMVYGAGLGARF